VTSVADRARRTITWQEASASRVALERALEAARAADPTVGRLLASGEQVIYTGAGTSYHLARTVAWVHRTTLRRPALAAPLSELLLRQDGVLNGGDPERQPIVVISRSGATSEGVAVAERFGAARHPIVAVTCRPDSPITGIAPHSLVSPAGDETAIVMTRSFTSMLALVLRVIANLAADTTLMRDLDGLPARWEQSEAATEGAFALAEQAWSRIVILGGGPANGVAHEVALKITEMSQAPTSTYEPLEFRHGPISVCEPGVLVITLVIPPGARAELRVTGEVRALGSAAWVLGGDLPAGRWQDDSGNGMGPLHRTDLGAALHPAARLLTLMPPLQAFAVGVAVARGCDPDRPRHLSQVVRLSE